MLTIGLYGIPDTTSTLGTTYTHDHGVALMRDGRVLTVVELERYTGVKQDNRLSRYLSAIIAPWLRPGEDVRFISVNTFVGDTFISEDGNLRIEPTCEPGIPEILYPARCHWFPDGLTRRPAEAWIMCHEFAHVASALPFIGTFPEDALLTHIDGGASRSACSFWRWAEGRATCLHHAWDDLKDVVNNFNANPLARAILGEPLAAHLSIPGKLMGYSAHGACVEDEYRWLRERRWFLDHEDDPAKLLKAVNTRRSTPLAGFDLRDRGLMGIAAAFQRAFEEQVSSTILAYAGKIGARDLVYSGGAGLNIPTNRLLVESGAFRQVFIPPPASDAGLALGAAAWVEFLDHGPLRLHGPFLNRFDVPDNDDVVVDVEQVAALLTGGRVVGICTGAAEIGPRALGHRSLLARADDVILRRRLSEGIKKREWYRPLAPILCEEAARVVIGDVAAAAPISRYMLGAWPVADAYREAFKGVMHADGTIRAQVVRADDEDNRYLHGLLLCLWEDHGLPGVINTSFNPRGKPILHRHEDALPMARSMGLDALVLPDRLEIL